MRDLGWIPGLGRSPGEGYSYPLQYSHTHTHTHTHTEALSIYIYANIHIATPWLNYSFTLLLSENHSACNSMDRSPLGSSVHGVLQARILPWVPILFSWGSSWQRDQSKNSALQVDSLLSEPPGPPKFYPDPK